MLRFGNMMWYSRRPSVYRQRHARSPRAIFSPWLRHRAQFGGVRGLSELDAPFPSVRESYPESDIASTQRSCDTIYTVYHTVVRTPSHYQLPFDSYSCHTVPYFGKVLPTPPDHAPRQIGPTVQPHHKIIDHHYARSTMLDIRVYRRPDLLCSERDSHNRLRPFDVSDGQCRVKMCSAFSVARARRARDTMGTMLRISAREAESVVVQLCQPPRTALDKG
uniref:Uncharacterized protein n=1 Tax=Anopheles farauti TaxID=69004 RepID=A0A182R185_9DIPT